MNTSYKKEKIEYIAPSCKYKDVKIESIMNNNSLTDTYTNSDGNVDDDWYM